MTSGARSMVPPRLLPVVALAAAAWLAGPAAAQGTLLHGHISTSFIPYSEQNWPNVPVAALQTMVAHDPHGNDAIANGSLSLPAGRVVLSPHACSGGGPGYGGTSTADARVANVMDYKIVSATLPDGTPDTIVVNWSLVSRVNAVGMDMIGANTGSSASATFQFTVAPNYNLVVNKTGGITRALNTSGQQKITSGNSNAESDSAHFTFPMQVGQIIRVTLTCEAGANSGVEAGQTDADVQLTALWGLTSKNANASVVSTSDLNQPAPPASGATYANAWAALPSKQGSLPCFSFSYQPEDVSLCGTTDAGFSVGTTGGGGPYTYQWRRNGVPIDLQANPTAQSALLTLSNVTPADAGQYDVVVTDHCGNRISNAATLSVCAIDADGPALRTRLAPAHPAPFRASTTLGFDLAAAGDAKLEVFDVRGARVRLLASGRHPAGHTDVRWQGDNETGRPVPAGVYMVRFTAGGFVASERIVRMR